MTHSPPHPTQQRHPDIAALVERFYTDARQDPLLGPVFAAAVQDWPHHLAALTGFWAAQLRGRGSYRGQPMAVHRALAQGSGSARLTEPMFDRWLALWQAATRATMPPEDAARLQARAAAIAQALRAAVADKADKNA